MGIIAQGRYSRRKHISFLNLEFAVKSSDVASMHDITSMTPAGFEPA